MGSSAKKKREKKQDFQKTKLKVGKARPKNTNATDTNFAAKSILLKQQSLSENARDATTLLDHNLSLLSSRTDTQRRDALLYLTSVVASQSQDLPRPTSTILAKAQPLILDGSASVRLQLLKLFKVLTPDQLGPLDQTLLYTRAGLTHLSNDIRTTSLDVLDWLLETNGDAVVNAAGGWVKLLHTFQNLLSWQGLPSSKSETVGQWTTNKSADTKTTTSKLTVHQLTTMAKFLRAGLISPVATDTLRMERASALFPLSQNDAHVISYKADIFDHLNLFGTPREVENEIYDDPEQRADVFVELELATVFRNGVNDAKSVGGEVGRAAAMVEKALRLVPSS